MEARVTKEAIEVIAQSIGISNLSPDVSVALAPDVEYRVREVMQEAIKCMRHARRTILMADDVDYALRFRNLEPTCGSSNSVKFKRAPDHSDLFYIDDKDVEFKHVIEAPLPNAPPDTSINVHWLAVEGIQPSIPQNSSPEATSDGKRIEYKDDGLPVRHVLSRELQLYFEKITEWTLTRSGSNLFRQAVSSLGTDSGLHPLVPYFTCFIAEEITRNMDNGPVLLALMRVARSLLQNPHVHIEPYLHQLMPSIITCLIAKHLGSRLSDNHWDLRNFTANTLALICKRFGHVYHDLQPRVIRTLLHAFLDPTKSLPQHYGAIQGLAGLGPNVVGLVILPNLELYLQYLTPAMSLERQKDQEKRREAWFVYGALMVAAGGCMYERVKALPELVSPPTRGVWKGQDSKLGNSRQSKQKASRDNLTQQPPLKKIASDGTMGVKQMQMQMQMQNPQQVPTGNMSGRDSTRKEYTEVGRHLPASLSEHFGESISTFTPKHELFFFL
ncbi:PREDICTED: transcription initiation factor TFIID subunit 6b [Tarenaya hassleriana]|uniref:transcription initiation factor TFIID subunit 6b n=1 Tax=Tarenaya hassleriana TaxID=28532 RepID=UPI00053C27B5|nr:PREDICTED: transcription initiation factor TFIID subunit 6b [Tarenaya hassleriana]